MPKPRKRPKLIRNREHWLCSKCGKWKLRADFQKSAMTTAGISSACRKCLSEAKAAARVVAIRFPKTCLRCGHKWNAYIEHPVVCAKCRSPYWNRLRMRQRV